MPSHSVHRLLHYKDSGHDTCDVEAELECGCRVKQNVKKDRLVLTTTGERLLAGKYRCPLAHPVRRRVAPTR